jgi:hypothetical protein
VKDTDFQQLLTSVKEAGRIKRGEQEPARKFEVRAEDVRAIENPKQGLKGQQGPQGH